MGIYLNPDNEGFSTSVRSKIYIDKTGLIDYMNQILDTEDKFISVSRPRRFGKSMAAKMLIAYYSRGCNSYELFQNYEIAEKDSFLKNLNKYDVIRLDMQLIRSTAMNEGCRDKMLFYLQERVIEELESYIDLNFDGLKDAIIYMIGGERCEIDTGAFQNDMTSFRSKDDILTLLVHLGYLAYDKYCKEVYIPNEEIREEFIRAVKNSGWAFEPPPDRL